MDTDDLIIKRFPKSIRGYVVMLLSVVAMSTFGIIYTFGNLLPYLVSYLRVMNINPTLTKGDMIWLQSFMGGAPLSFFVGALLERYFGGRIGGLLASAAFSGGIALSYFSIKISYFLLLLTFGLMLSMGQGAAYTAILTTVQKWFPTNVGVASGVIIAGYGLTGFIFSPIETKFVNPHNMKVNGDGYFTDKDLLDKIPYMFLLIAAITTIMQLIGLTFVGSPKESKEDQATQEVPLKTIELIKSPMVQIAFATLTLNSTWYEIMSGLFKAYGEKFIDDDLFLAVVDSLCSASNCISRVIWGYTADKIGYQQSMVILCTIGSFLMWTLPLVKHIGSRYMYMIWMMLQFSCLGGTYTLLAYVLHKSFRHIDFGVSYGCVQLGLTFGSIFAALISQFLLGPLGYDWIYIIMPMFLVASLILTAFIHKTRYGKVPGVCWVKSS